MCVGAMSDSECQCQTVSQSAVSLERGPGKVNVTTAGQHADTGNKTWYRPGKLVQPISALPCTASHSRRIENQLTIGGELRKTHIRLRVTTYNLQLI